MRRYLIVTILTVFCSIAVEAKDLIDAKEVLNKVELNYLSLKAYSDIGTVKSDFETINFKTQFVKPDRFVFIWSSKIKNTPPIIFNSAIWSNGKEVYKFYSEQKDIESEESLYMAIAEATGVSLGAAHNISSILGLSRGFKLTKIMDPTLIGQNVIENEPCYHIRGGHSKFEDTYYDLFISISTFMIKKIVKHSKAGKTETVYYKIFMNPHISDSLFNKKQLREDIANSELWKNCRHP